ncbi:LOW QUALITY PROTEIN: DNA-directed RNA polymerase, mitochondrial-like [Octopus sinensis]|uniref:DNA-directed RNA polymerase n=1 Tax=Octopus sinensis TaxID=2607531 RepID=A0A7E6ELA6_9MOLL|nr:LOW QUALITY PROTEIN: DNA-directed RNA polymerase, mitochondrial-like [Octopus sinensis]
MDFMFNLKEDTTINPKSLKNVGMRQIMVLSTEEFIEMSNSKEDYRVPIYSPQWTYHCLTTSTCAHKPEESPVKLEELLVSYAFLKPSANDQTVESTVRGIRCRLSIALNVIPTCNFQLLESPFWFPLFVDFRGRCYPVAPYLNHTGDDASRGLLQFNVGKPLGPNGLRWLKIHLSNLSGLGKRFHDGSFNGLQHYAALGRDSVAAHSVNLVSGSHPNDAYLDVVEMIEKSRKKDEAQGNLLAGKLEGCITRKVVKQTVMTTVYGVTRYGAEMQVLRKLIELDKICQSEITAAANYITKSIFNALGTIFCSTTNIQVGDVSDGRTGLNTMPLAVNSVKQRNAFPPNFIHSLDATHMLLTALHCKKYFCTHLRAGLIFAAVHDCYWTHPGYVDQMNRVVHLFIL